MDATRRVTLELTYAQALVLYEWLCREDAKGIPTEHEAEQVVLWKLEAQLDKLIDEALSPDYAAALALARAHVVNTQGA